VLLSARAFGQATPDPTGEWIGTYTCIHNQTALRLGIRTQADGTLSVLFRFGGLPSNPSVPRGCFTLTGAFDPISRKVTLSPERWLLHPPGFVMVGLDGKLDPDGSRLAGTITGGSACTTFDVERSVSSGAGDDSCGSGPPVTAHR
jgi:hypothetical protein